MRSRSVAVRTLSVLLLLGGVTVRAERLPIIGETFVADGRTAERRIRVRRAGIAAVNPLDVEALHQGRPRALRREGW
jgi:hypothetical protein